ncbi:hypothetical protein GR158_12350 [Shinella sp. AETb1-6]|uniref:phage tail assembly chaperone n=1 Tax=Shinella TaxID=323620 RepID=UPI00106E6C4D|nr:MULTISPECIES: hypothetical protein [Shinella]MCD1264544.1 hypothetical protein [Shinella sumterensis]MXN51914.1 hypothetical protein [Shinella sp. AETb1-6]TFE94095.1 hypothetical protein B5M44_24050 [Shinella sumterensis]
MAERKIRNMEIRVDRPLASEALRLQARLMRAAGGVADQLPDLIGAIRSAQSEEAKQAVGVKFIGVLTGVFEGLEPHEFAHLVGDIVGLAKLKRPSGHYETMDLDGDLSEDFGAIIPVVAFVLKEVFGDFFSAAPGSGSRGVAGRA